LGRRACGSWPDFGQPSLALGPRTTQSSQKIAFSGVVNAQVLEEFYVHVTRKIPKPLSKQQGLELIQDYLSWEAVGIHGGMVAEAAQMEEQLKLSFWDALIVVSAQRSGAELLLSEDFQSGRQFGSLTVQTPF
jgi:predicted nucleic acid-binding protein